MNSFLIGILGFSNLVLALLTFVLMTRPEKLLGLLAFVAGVREEWRLGFLMEKERERLLRFGRALAVPTLFLLFMWSVFCGVMIRILGY